MIGQGVLIGIGLGLLGVAICYAIARVVVWAVDEAHRAEIAEQLRDDLTNDPRLIEIFRSIHNKEQ